MWRMIMQYCKKDIDRFDKIVAPLLLVLAVVFIVLGVAMIVDGVRSQMGGGYGDNIVLGAIILSTCPLLSVATFKLMTMTNDEWSDY